MNSDSLKIKATIIGLGADLCGIASSERFHKAPKGFHPTDIYNDCQSVIVFAKRVPTAPLFIDNCVPYTHVNTLMMQEVDRLTLNISLTLEELRIKNVIIPTDDPYEYWESEQMYGRAILSLRHAGYLAGLGVLGKNNLLINEKFGNMIQIGAVLVPIKLQPDPIATYEGCLENCTLCLDSCPQSALDGKTVNQKLCRPLSNFRSEKGYILKKCNICRKVCPNALGLTKNV